MSTRLFVELRASVWCWGRMVAFEGMQCRHLASVPNCFPCRQYNVRCDRCTSGVRKLPEERSRSRAIVILERRIGIIGFHHCCDRSISEIEPDCGINLLQHSERWLLLFDFMGAVESATCGCVDCGPRQGKSGILATSTYRHDRVGAHHGDFALRLLLLPLAIV